LRGKIVKLGGKIEIQRQAEEVGKEKEKGRHRAESSSKAMASGRFHLKH
jgi:hypothetical protein